MNTAVHGLTAALRRCSLRTRRRTVKLLCALLAYDLADMDTLLTRHKYAHTALSAACAIAHYALCSTSPRFLFALGSDGAMSRSNNCGRTWRRLWPTSPYSAPQVLTRASAMSPLTYIDTQCDSAVSGDAHVTSDVTQRARASPPWCTRSSATHTATMPTATCVSAGCGEVVVVGGRNAFLAVSADRGLHYSVVSAHLIERVLGSRATITHACVVTRTRVLVASGQSVAVVGYECVAQDACTHFAVAPVLQCTHDVCMLRACARNSSPATEVLIAERGILHVSWDSGYVFTAVRHRLGVVRDVQPLDTLRNSCLPPLPPCSHVVRALTRCGDATATMPRATTRARVRAALRQEQQQQPRRQAYQYGAAYTLTRSPATLSLCAQCAFMCLCTRCCDANDAQALWHRCYLVVGCDSDVLPYDYACVLHVGVAACDGGDVSVFSVAHTPSFIPSVRSAATERLVCAVACVGGGTRCVALRGNTSGLDVTHDLCTWTVATSAAAFAPVGLFVADYGTFIVCTRRGVVATMTAMPKSTNERAGAHYAYTTSLLDVAAV